LSSRFRLEADTAIADATKAAPHGNPVISYAAVAVSVSVHTVSSAKEFADQ
jgi:acyl CoA:acetate/3-ketoacid CoA transferase alpha subunit